MGVMYLILTASQVSKGFPTVIVLQLNSFIQSPSWSTYFPY